MSFDYTCVNVNIYIIEPILVNLEDFLYVCHMKGFMRKIVAFLFAVIFGLTSAIFLSAGADNELVKPQDPSYPYSLIDIRAQSLPM